MPCGIPSVDRVGQVPLRDVTGVAEIRLDVGEVELRRTVDRLERPREPVDARHVVASRSVILTPPRDRRSRVLTQFGFDEGDRSACASRR